MPEPNPAGTYLLGGRGQFQGTDTATTVTHLYWESEKNQWVVVSTANPLPCTSISQNNSGDNGGDSPNNQDLSLTTIPIIANQSTLILTAAVNSRSKTLVQNNSGLPGAPTPTQTGIWCSYGVAAVIGQGFYIGGGGGALQEDLPAVIDPRALYGIAASNVTISVGSVQS